MKQTEINATSQGNSNENAPKTAADLPRPPRYVSLHERTAYKKGKWTREEDEMLKNIVSIFGERKWRKIARYVKGRSAIQCLQRWSKILKPGVVKGPWSIEEDQRLLEWVSKEGPKKWAQCARLIPGRSGKQCRERWLNNLNPNIKKGKWTDEEDRKLFELYKVYGSAWSKIATHLEGRTENCVKNRYYSTLRKQAQEKKAEILKEEMMTKVEKGATNNDEGGASNEGENPEGEKPTKSSKKAASSDEPSFKKKLVKRRRRNLPALIEEKNSSVPRREEIHHNLNLMVPENPELVKRLPQSQPPLERVHQPMEEVRDMNRPRLNPPQCDQEKQKILSLLNHISELETLLSRARGELSYLENEFLNHVSRNF